MMLLLVCMVLGLAGNSVSAQEIPLATGVHWTQSPESVKKACLLGIADAFALEAAYEGANPPPDGQSIVPRLARGMKGHTLDTVRENLDKF